LTYEFDPAKCAPIPWLRVIGERYPTLDFELRNIEPNMGEFGLVLIARGKLTPSVHIGSDEGWIR